MVEDIAGVAKDVLLAPIYLYQGRKVKRDTVRLPEPEGERHGQVILGAGGKNRTRDVQTKSLTLMVVGDSAAAGVGSKTQTDGLVGKLVPALQQQEIIKGKYHELIWSLQATTGHTSFDILRRLYVLPTPSTPVDIMVLSVGVNDTTSNVSTLQWQQQLEDIIAVAQRKFGVRALIFSSLPPMEKMPALPVPLNAYVGAKATKLDTVLQQVCTHHDGVHYMAADFISMAKKHNDGKPADGTIMFASDGFHPSQVTYGYWAQQLSDLIAELLAEVNTHS